MSRAAHLSLAAALLAASGCTEVDDTVVVAIGTLRPSMAHSGLGTQIVSVNPLDSRIQAIEWQVAPKPPGADATDGLHLVLNDVGINLTCVDPTGECSGQECSFMDTAVVSPRANGRCAAGVIVDGLPQDDPGFPARLDVVLLSVTLYRLEPIAFEMARQAVGKVADFDGDTIPDAQDNCPLIRNADQRDTGMKGFGDACSAFEPFVGLFLLDSDADLVPDLRDNCPDTANPDQADEGKPFGTLMVPDGIGDACNDREQVATVALRMVPPIDPPTFTKALLSLNPVLRGNTFLTLDYADAFTCIWETETCTLAEAGVTLCRDLQGGSACP